jgi:hypothetical protein
MSMEPRINVRLVLMVVSISFRTVNVEARINVL